MDSIRVIVKRPGEDPAELTIPDRLEKYQELVRGYIEPVRLSGDLLMLVNENGKLLNLQPNFRLGYDVIVGPAVFVGVNGESFESCPYDADYIREVIRNAAYGTDCHFL